MKAPTAGHAQSFGLREIESLLGISRRTVSRLVAEGFVAPTRGPRNAYRFSFQDVVLLRAAHGLQQARIPPRKLVRALQRLRAALPDTLPLTGLRIAAEGNEVVVQEGGRKWAPGSGQWLLDFQLAPPPAQAVKSFEPQGRRAVPTKSTGERPADLFAAAVALESEDAEAARQLYRRALALDPAYEDAYLNLGAMLCEQGECRAAVALYRQAQARLPASAAVAFNFGVALEDRGDRVAALKQYDRALQLDPRMADAHFNAARLHESLGHAQLALRHFSAYQRLNRS